MTPRTIAWLEASSSSSEDSFSSSQISEEENSQSSATNALNDKPGTEQNQLLLSGREAELEYSKKRVLEKRNRRIVEVAARAKSIIPREDNDSET